MMVVMIIRMVVMVVMSLFWTISFERIGLCFGVGGGGDVCIIVDGRWP